MARKKTTKPVTEDVAAVAVKHKDRRTNIPTRELSAFAGDDQRAPKTLLYPPQPKKRPSSVGCAPTA